MDLPSPFGTDEADFDSYDHFVPDHLPDPGPFLADAAVLTGDTHVAFHRTTRDLFEERSVKDATFGYNLARLNLDTRHPDAGFRYAEESDAVLRAEFTPTTEFCPQSDTLCVGAFRAWNALADRHGYDLVRVRVDPMHQRARTVNGRLRSLETSHADGIDLAPVEREAAGGLRREDDAPDDAGGAGTGTGRADAGTADDPDEGPATPF
ncbi:hypothetical protein [Haloglomus litoreum]|uniref:hypothetical protein n=1 Tax=Haloglomus litoreum TaxID=3034026 RepID=UPI0023E89565|nr:hypothetical protein [Haloglomus sp. DT116]